MAKFISFEVSGNTNHLLNGEHLVNVDNIAAVEQTADETVVVTLDTQVAAKDTLTLTFSTANDSAAPVNPVYATGGPLRTNINYALTANPGGVKAKVQYGDDDNTDKVYLVNIAYS